MATFKTYKSYWHFAHSIAKSYRYAFAIEAVEFLQQLKAKLEEDPAHLSQGAKLCRAQVGHNYGSLKDDKGNIVDHVPCAFGPERMKPQRDRAKEGRVNPKGIPCLYLCTDQETAIAEVRPAQGQLVSVGYFKILKDCKLASFTVERNRHVIYLNEPPADKVDDIVLGDLTYAFSRPVTPDDQIADYAPTQVIAEYVRHLGYDGVYYRSNLGPGMNIALFDVDAAALKACDLITINDIKYSFSQADNTYFVVNKADEGNDTLN